MGKSALLTVREAAAMLGISAASLYDAARRRGWAVEKVPTGTGRDRTHYRRKEVEAYLKAHGKAGDATMDNWIKMREWADSLKTRPTLEEIAAHTLEPYNVAEMEALIGSRPCRGLKPVWPTGEWCNASCTDVPQCWYRKHRRRG